MQYRYFSCPNGHNFHAFVEFNNSTELKASKDGTYKVVQSFKPPTTKCPNCEAESKLCLNDPDAIGTKMLFNYMEP